MPHKPDAHAFVIFGATGDLTRRKLLSAYAGLCYKGQAPGHSFLLGVARRDQDDAKFNAQVKESLADAGMPGGTFCPGVHYHSLGQEENDYPGLAERLAQLEKEYQTNGNRIFYLALPAGSFARTIQALGEAKLHRSKGWTRLVIEKPFGVDLASARELKELMLRYFDESQVYLIDHYLGKESVQNLLAFRLANPVFESLWNRDRIAHVQFTVGEQLGLEGRNGYYDQAGALRDMVQNHITQLLALTAMEVPASYSAQDIRYEKNKLLRSVSPLRPADAVFGQYGPGVIGDKQKNAYRDEPDIPKGSNTETFAALRLEINNGRWQGVPFYVRTGKRLPQRISEIAVAFRHPPARLLHDMGAELQENVLRIVLQPNEGFALQINVKSPGQPLRLKSIPLHFHYNEAFGPLADAYETLLFDVMVGDQSLFAETDAVETAWKLYTPLLSGDVPVHSYASGTWGPAAADGLLRPGHTWLTV